MDAGRGGDRSEARLLTRLERLETHLEQEAWQTQDRIDRARRETASAVRSALRPIERRVEDLANAEPPPSPRPESGLWPGWIVVSFAAGLAVRFLWLGRGVVLSRMGRVRPAIER